MTLITLGTNPTILTPTLEEMLVALVDFGQSQELNSARNPNQINNITSSINRDTATMNASVNFPCSVVEGNDGLEISGVDYLNGVTFTFGQGASTLKGDNWVDAIIRTTIRQKNLELDSVRNTTQANYISYTISPATIIGSNANATFSAQVNLPVVYESNVYPASYKGLVYLGNL